MIKLEDTHDWKVFCPGDCDYERKQDRITRKGIKFVIDVRCPKCKQHFLDAVELSC